MTITNRHLSWIAGGATLGAIGATIAARGGSWLSISLWGVSIAAYVTMIARGPEHPDA